MQFVEFGGGGTRSGFNLCKVMTDSPLQCRRAAQFRTKADREFGRSCSPVAERAAQTHGDGDDDDGDDDDDDDDDGGGG